MIMRHTEEISVHKSSTYPISMHIRKCQLECLQKDR